MKVENNKVVLINYKLIDSKGEVIDSTDDKAPMAYLHGSRNIIPGLERELKGKQAGDKLTVTIPHEDAYGPYVKELVQVVDKNVFQGAEEIHKGMRVNVQTSQGDTIAVISDVGEKTITLDMNHPLAGKDLTFEVEVVDVRTASDAELEHGHVHGPGGHHH